MPLFIVSRFLRPSRSFKIAFRGVLGYASSNKAKDGDVYRDKLCTPGEVRIKKDMNTWVSRMAEYKVADYMQEEKSTCFDKDQPITLTERKSL